LAAASCGGSEKSENQSAVRTGTSLIELWPQGEPQSGAQNRHQPANAKEQAVISVPINEAASAPAILKQHRPVETPENTEVDATHMHKHLRAEEGLHALPGDPRCSKTCPTNVAISKCIQRQVDSTRQQQDAVQRGLEDVLGYEIKLAPSIRLPCPAILAQGQVRGECKCTQEKGSSEKRQSRNR